MQMEAGLDTGPVFSNGRRQLCAGVLVISDEAEHSHFAIAAVAGGVLGGSRCGDRQTDRNGGEGGKESMDEGSGSAHAW